MDWKILQIQSAISDELEDTPKPISDRFQYIKLAAIMQLSLSSITWELMFIKEIKQTSNLSKPKPELKRECQVFNRALPSIIQPEELGQS